MDTQPTRITNKNTQKILTPTPTTMANLIRMKSNRATTKIIKNSIHGILVKCHNKKWNFMDLKKNKDDKIYLNKKINCKLWNKHDST